MRGILDRFAHTEAPVVEDQQVNEKRSNDKEAAVQNDAVGTGSQDDRDSDEISTDAQTGVQGVEALTKVWTRNDLILAYITYV